MQTENNLQGPEQERCLRQLLCCPAAKDNSAEERWERAMDGDNDSSNIVSAPPVAGETLADWDALWRSPDD